MRTSLDALAKIHADHQSLFRLLFAKSHPENHYEIICLNHCQLQGSSLEYRDRHQDAFFGFLNVLRCIKVLFIHFQWTEAREKFEKAADLMAVDNRTKKTIWGQFWSAHQVSKQFIIVVVNFYLR